MTRRLCIALALGWLAACGDPGIPCVVCAADADCAAPRATCRGGYCVEPEQDPLRCPHVDPTLGGSSGSSGGASTSGS